MTIRTALAQLHLGLPRIAPTTGATVGYAAAVGKAIGPRAGFDVLFILDPALRATIGLGEATRAFLLNEPGRPREAIDAFENAVSLTNGVPLRHHLQDKRASLAGRIQH